MAPRKNQVATTTTGTAVADMRPIDAFKRKIELAKDTITAMMPDHLKARPDKFFAMVVTAVANEPKLLECSQSSLLQATIEAADLGLSLNKNLKEGDILPVWAPGGTVAQFRPRFMGLMKLAKQSGQVKDIWAKVVYERDHFEYDEFNRTMDHRPYRAPTVRQFLEKKLGRYPTDKEIAAYNKSQEQQDEHAAACDKGDLTHVWCAWILPDGTKSFEVYDREKVHRSRDKSEGYRAFKAGKIKSTPWVTDEEEMWRKTAVRLASKYMPMSSDKFAQAVAIDNAREAGEPVIVDHETGEVRTDPAVIDITAPEPSAAAQSQADRLAARITPQPEPQSEPDPDMPPAPPLEDDEPEKPKRNWTAETDALIAEANKLTDPRAVTAFAQKHAKFIGDLEFGSPKDAERLNLILTR